MQCSRTFPPGVLKEEVMILGSKRINNPILIDFFNELCSNLGL